MKNCKKILMGVFVLLLASAALRYAIGEPEGASIEYVSNTTKSASPAENRSDAKGTITTLRLSTMQQNIRWKAYVGNVSGTLILADADTYSIYQWSSGGSPDGEVYMTRNSSVDWSTVQCANLTDIQTEQTVLGHLGSAADNIVNTFSSTVHQSFDVGERTITNSTCRSTVTRVNNTNQAITESSKFQEVLLMDGSRKLIYTSLIDQETSSYKAASQNTTYDFQAILPDYALSGIATYYFYVEITG